MTDERFENIETKLLYQEHTIAELNDALTSQQTQIAVLENVVRVLTDRLESLAESVPGDNADEQPPPHY